MPQQTDADQTLPSAVASPPGKYRDQGLILTIIFHPHTSRIGQTAVVPGRPGTVPWILGRRSPVFGDNSVAGCPLENRHISRQALEFVPTGKRLLVRRFDASSRCRIAGCELDESIELDWEELQKGVPLMLGHTVVLLLRLGRQAEPEIGESACADSLRGSSAYMAGLRQQLALAAATDLDVLIRGETGTGKELVAGAIHSGSPRAAAPLVIVNMAAVPPELAAAALFGSAKGAFTGADRAAAGYFQQAQGGSLFLDEIGDTSTAVQPQLLRALQQKEVQVVGGAIRHVDVRVISATDAALEGDACHFKSALRHRLAAYEIHLLPLREHPEDIGELLLHFLVVGASEAGRPELILDEHSGAQHIAAWADLFHRFVCYSWPGNVRQLLNFSRQVIMASKRFLTLTDNITSALADDVAAVRVLQDQPLRRSMRDVDEQEFDMALQKNHFEPTAAAQQLGVSRTAVYRRIDESQRHRLANEVPPSELQQAVANNSGDSAATALQLRVSLTSLRTRLRALELEWH